MFSVNLISLIIAKCSHKKLVKNYSYGLQTTCTKSVHQTLELINLQQSHHCRSFLKLEELQQLCGEESPQQSAPPPIPTTQIRTHTLVNLPSPDRLL